MRSSRLRLRHAIDYILDVSIHVDAALVGRPERKQLRGFNISIHLRYLIRSENAAVLGFSIKIGQSWQEFIFSDIARSDFTQIHSDIIIIVVFIQHLLLRIGAQLVELLCVDKLLSIVV